jgi:Beta-lactamase
MLALLFAYALGVGRAADQSGKLSDEKQAKIEGAVSTFMASRLSAPGLSVAVVQDGEFVCSAGFGMADLENSVPAISQTLYRLGSISKPITATSAMGPLGARQARSGYPRSKVLPGIPSESMAHHYSRAFRTPRRNPLLQRT